MSWASWLTGGMTPPARPTVFRARLRIEELEGRVVPTNGVTLPLHLDFGTDTSPVATGYTRFALSRYNGGVGYGWQNLGGLSARDRGTADPLTRDLQLGTDDTFLVDLANGTYDVTVTLGDPTYKHELMSLFAEGQKIASGLTSAAGEVIRPTFQVTVSDGQLNLRFLDEGGSNPQFAVVALDIQAHPDAAPLHQLFVSPTGSDANDGLTAATALQTLAAAARRVTYGTTVNLAAGTYQGQQLVTRADGAAGQPITFASYGGTAIIDGTGLTWSPGGNQNQGLVELRNPYQQLLNVKVVNSPNSGIILGANNLTVSGNEVAETQRHGISTDTRFQPLAPGTGVLLQNLTLQNNNVYHAVLKGAGYGQAVSVIGDGFLVAGNTVHDSLTEGIDVWLGAKHGEVRGNTVYGNGMMGIYVDGASYVRIDGNTVYGNRAGIGVTSENPTYSTHDVWVFNNVVYDHPNDAGISIWDSSTSPGIRGSQNVLINNNTLVNNRTSIYLYGSSNTAEIMNNLSYATLYNLRDSSTSSTYNVHNNVWLTSLSGFVNAAGKDFRLVSSSPAIDAGGTIPTFADDLGTTFSVTVDYLGLNRTSGLRTDAGAFEYQGP